LVARLLGRVQRRVRAKGLSLALTGRVMARLLGRVQTRVRPKGLSLALTGRVMARLLGRSQRRVRAKGLSLALTGRLMARLLGRAQPRVRAKGLSLALTRIDKLWMWRQLVRLQFEVVRGPVGVVWGRFGGRLAVVAATSTERRKDRWFDRLPGDALTGEETALRQALKV
jgi:hypothetical protein